MIVFFEELVKIKKKIKNEKRKGLQVKVRDHFMDY